MTDWEAEHTLAIALSVWAATSAAATAGASRSYGWISVSEGLRRVQPVDCRLTHDEYLLARKRLLGWSFLVADQLFARMFGVSEVG